MLSLSPRADLFVFNFPKDFLPKEVADKYAKVINQDKSVIRTPIDYLNESVQGVAIPGISELLTEQTQHSPERPENHGAKMGLNAKRINIEPSRTNVTYSPKNILAQVGGEITVTLRKNQGLYNYFMMYETIFHKVLKEYANVEKDDDVFFVDVLDETGKICVRIKLFQPRIDGIDGLEFNYNKQERQTETFDVKFRYNNIDFDLIMNDEVVETEQKTKKYLEKK
jgi:hypothetical protein